MKRVTHFTVEGLAVFFPARLALLAWRAGGKRPKKEIQLILLALLNTKSI